MEQPRSQAYFRKLVYYVMDLVLRLDRLLSDAFRFSFFFYFREYSKASQLAESISDECFILPDLAACGMSCVSSCVMETISSSLLRHLCFPSIEREIVSPRAEFPYSIGIRTALFVLPLVLQAMTTISLACCASSVLNAKELPESLWRRFFSSRCHERCRW